MNELEYEAHKIAMRKLCDGSTYNTAHLLLNYKEMNEETHGPICDALDADTLRKLICVPRGTFKSSIGAVAFPIKLLRQNPNRRILIDSELFGNSVTYLNEIKNKMMEPKFKEVYGDWMPTNKQQKELGYSWSDSEITISIRNKVYKEASITCGGVGTTRVGQHYDVIIGDDYNSPKNTATPEQREKVIEHYRYNQSILDPGGIYVIIGTRYHEDDLIGWILKNELGISRPEEFEKVPKVHGVYNLETKGLIGGL